MSIPHGCFDGAKEAAKLFKTILLQKERWGINKYIYYLHGSMGMSTKFYHTKDPTFGSGSNHSDNWWKLFFHMLVAEGYFIPRPFKSAFMYGLSDKAKDWLKIYEESGNTAQLIIQKGELRYHSRKWKDCLANGYEDCAEPGVVAEGPKWSVKKEDTVLNAEHLVIFNALKPGVKFLYKCVVLSFQKVETYSKRTQISTRDIYLLLEMAVEVGLPLPLHALRMSTKMVRYVRRVYATKLRNDITYPRAFMDRRNDDALTYEMLDLIVSILKFEQGSTEQEYEYPSDDEEQNKGDDDEEGEEDAYTDEEVEDGDEGDDPIDVSNELELQPWEWSPNAKKSRHE